MKIRRRPKIGLGIISVGLFPLLVLGVWRATLNTVPVSKPVSLSVGHVSQPFTVNFTGSYTIRIEAERKLPHETLQCLLGIRDYVPEGQCKNIAPALNISWTLLQDGQTIKTGSSGTAVGGIHERYSCQRARLVRWETGPPLRLGHGCSRGRLSLIRR